MNTGNMIQHAAPKSSSLVARIAPLAIGLAVMTTVGPAIAGALHATAIVLFELGHVSALAMQIFCN
jgi:hypothetical protein